MVAKEGQLLNQLVVDHHVEHYPAARLAQALHLLQRMEGQRAQVILQPFVTLDNLGESAGISVEEARKDGEFFSKEDLLRRTKLTSTNVQDLADMGVLDGLNESDQLSLFDF